MVVWFDQKGMVLQNVDQKIPGGVYHNVNAFSLQARHDILIAGGRHDIRDRPCQDQKIPLPQLIELIIELCNVGSLDGRSLPVDLRFLVATQLDIDPGHSLCHIDKVALNLTGS